MRRRTQSIMAAIAASVSLLAGNAVAVEYGDTDVEHYADENGENAHVSMHTPDVANVLSTVDEDLYEDVADMETHFHNDAGDTLMADDIDFDALLDELEELEEQLDELKDLLEDLRDEHEDDDDEEQDDEHEDTDDEDFEASLDGSQEVPAVETNGSGEASFSLSGDDLHYDIVVEDLTAPITAAHFHAGERGVNGPVIEPITFSGNAATGTWTDLTDEEMEMLLDEEIYVNVHTSTYPNGEIRGQVEK